MPPARSSRPWMRVAAAVGGYSAFALAFFAPVLLRGRLLAPEDGLRIHLVDFLSARRAWEPDLFCGLPVLGDPEHLSWHPLMLLWQSARHVLPLQVAWNGWVLSAYVTAAVGAFGLARRLTGSTRGAAVAGLVFAWGGFFTAHANHPKYLHAVAALPLLLWALECLRERVTAGAAAAAAGAVALMLLAGHPQAAFYGLVLAAVVALVRGARAPAGPVRFGIAAGGSVVLGLALAALLLVPAWELAGRSVRADTSWELFTSYALDWPDLALVFLPFLHGGGAGLFERPHFGPWNLHETTAWIGLGVLMLAGAGAWAGRRRPGATLWTAVALVTLLLALGERTPLAWILWQVPGFDLFRAPARHLAEWNLAVAVLAAMGIAELESRDARARLRTVAWAAGAVGAGTLLAWLSAAARRDALHAMSMDRTGVPFHAAPWAEPALGVPLLVCAVSAAALLWWCRRPGRARTVVLIAVLALDLASFGWSAQWRADAPQPADLDIPRAMVPVRADLRARHARLATVLADHWTDDHPTTNLTRVWDVPIVSGYNALTPERIAETVEMIPDTGGSLDPTVLLPHHRGLDVAAAGLLVTPRGTRGPGGGWVPFADHLADVAGDRWRHVRDAGSISVFANTRALPRARLVGDVRGMTADQSLAAVRSSRLPGGEEWDPRRTALVEGAVPEAVASAGGAGSRARAEIAVAEPTLMRVRCSGDAPALLVTADTWHPGWRATVDGRSAEILRADHAFRGVVVPAGDHVVEFRYRPVSFLLGLAVTCIGLLLWIALTARGLVGRGREPAGADV